MKSKCYQKVTAILIGFWELLGEKSTLRPLYGSLPIWSGECESPPFLFLFSKVCLAVLGTLAGTIGKQMVRCSKLAKERRKQKEGNFLLIAGS